MSWRRLTPCDTYERRRELLWTWQLGEEGCERQRGGGVEVERQNVCTEKRETDVVGMRAILTLLGRSLPTGSDTYIDHLML